MLRYAPVKQLFDSIADDYRVYDDQNMIDYSTLIKVVKRCNADLSTKINPLAETLIDITNYKGKLPDNYDSFDFALLCGKHKRDVTPPKGFQIEQVTECVQQKGCNVCLQECEAEYKVVQKLEREWVEFTDLDVVKLIDTNIRCANNNPMNARSNSSNGIKIVGDYIHTSFATGTLYLSYVTSLVDEDGNLLFLDDPKVLEFYELACKKHILSNMVSNADDDVRNTLRDLKIDFSRERNLAISYVNMVEYNEMLDTLKQNRLKFHRRYVQPFYQNIAPRTYSY